MRSSFKCLAAVPPWGRVRHCVMRTQNSTQPSHELSSWQSPGFDMRQVHFTPAETQKLSCEADHIYTNGPIRDGENTRVYNLEFSVFLHKCMNLQGLSSHDSQLCEDVQWRAALTWRRVQEEDRCPVACKLSHMETCAGGGRPCCLSEPLHVSLGPVQTTEPVGPADLMLLPEAPDVFDGVFAQSLAPRPGPGGGRGGGGGCQTHGPAGRRVSGRLLCDVKTRRTEKGLFLDEWRRKRNKE